MEILQFSIAKLQILFDLIWFMLPGKMSTSIRYRWQQNSL